MPQKGEGERDREYSMVKEFALVLAGALAHS